MNMTYQLYQAERPKTPQELRDEAIRRGELAAALADMRSRLAIMLRPAGRRRHFSESGPSAPSIESISTDSYSHI